jgi:serine/threonine-protein kinase
MIGKLLGGRYQIVDILGTGGFGQTYVAQDIHRPGSPKCVVKHLKPASSNSSFLENARRLFQSEAQTLEKLGSHDQIPRLLAYFEENEEFYLVQDFIQGHPLSVALQADRRWSEGRVYHLLREVLGILEYVHSQGVIHRDIKPNNLIQRQEDNKLVLVDFGSVKQAWTQVVTAHGQTKTSFALGTPATIGIGTPGYMPTEQGRGRPRPNSDIYALGIIGIQALTGLSPMRFQEDLDTGEILWLHTVAQVDSALAQLLSKMVRYHFKDRYQTATEVLQDLARINIPEEPVNTADLLLEQVPLPCPPQSTIIFTEDARTSEPQHVVPVTLAGSTELYTSQINSHSVNPIIERSPLAVQLSVAQLPPPISPQPLSDQTNTFAPQVDSVNNTHIEPPSNNRVVSHTVQSQYKLRIGAGITAIILSLVAGYAIYWQPRPSVSKPLEQMKSLKAEGKYEECVSQASNLLEKSSYDADAQSILYECQVAQAIRFAGERNFHAAITEASKIPSSAAFYQNVQQLIGQWSNSILETATNEYQSGDLQQAIAIAQHIPESSPVYLEAQTSINQWNTEWQSNNQHVEAAKTALKAEKWEQAIAQANKVLDTVYWQQQTQPIIQTAESKLAEVKKTAETSHSTTSPQKTTPAVRTAAIAPKSTTTAPRRTVTPTTTRVTPQRRTTPAVPVKRVQPRPVNRTTTSSRVVRRPAATQPQRSNPPRTTTPTKPSYSWTTKTIP